jgi:hypothetical protein
MKLKNEFVKRVLGNVKASPREYSFHSWSFADKPTNEACGMLAVPGVDAEKLIRCVMDFGRYQDNIKHVVECRAVSDARFEAPAQVRFYQRVKIPILGEVHHELLMERLGRHENYEITAWRLLEQETAALDKKKGTRSQYNDGCWLVGDGVVGYALSSAPRRADVSFLKWKAMTTGADVVGSKVVRENIEAMSAWAARL